MSYTHREFEIRMKKCVTVLREIYFLDYARFSIFYFPYKDHICTVFKGLEDTFKLC